MLNFLKRIYHRITRTRTSRAPDSRHTPSGRRTTIRPQDDAATRRSLMRENDSADALARAGYRVEQNPVVLGPKNPDYRIEGRLFDNYAPSTGNPRNIWTEILEGKIRKRQADRIVLNLDDSPVTLEALRQQFNSWLMSGLKEVIVVKGGRVIPFWP